MLQKPPREPQHSHSQTADWNARISAATLQLTAKRTAAKLDGLEGWLPYYAGYTENFARTLIRASSQDGGQLRVLDPWNGSGTTTRAAFELGHIGFGYDINPVATLAAAAKLANAEDALHIHGLIKHLAEAPLERLERSDDPLLRWLPKSAAARFRAIQRGILTELAASSDGEVLAPDKSALPPLASFLLLALIRAGRSIATFQPSSNPTWSRPSGVVVRYQKGRLEREWAAHVKDMSEELTKASSNILSGGGGAIRLANSRNLPLADSTIDLVLSSPPYCTRIDYAKGTSFELAAMGISEDADGYRALRLDAMGTPLSRSNIDATPSAPLSKEVGNLLSSIKNHPSKASSTYYHRTYAQYFVDCHDSLNEIMRTLRPGGIAALIVQSSYYKEIYVDLPQLYIAEGASLGFKTSIAGVTKVKKAFSQLNPKSSAYFRNKTYEENIVLLEKPEYQARGA